MTGQFTVAHRFSTAALRPPIATVRKALFQGFWGVTAAHRRGVRITITGESIKKICMYTYLYIQLSTYANRENNRNRRGGARR